MKGVVVMGRVVFFGALSALSVSFAMQASAAPLPAGWTAVGTAGSGAPNGVVTAPPAYGPGYFYVTTDGSPSGGGTLPGQTGSETNGATLTSPSFAAKAGDLLEFYFNYVTSDGAGYADYSWATLNDAGTSNLTAVLFTARTKPSGNIVPGQDLPAADASFEPPSVEIIGGGPVWAELGSSSGSCYSAGCGYTGWIKSTYTVADAGTYKLLFGVTNWADTAYELGMALAGATIDGEVIGPPPVSAIPLPATAWLLGGGLLGLARLRRHSAARA